MESSQDALFKDLSDFALIEAKNDAEKSIHEASISFFFNLISAYHLEKKVRRRKIVFVVVKDFKVQIVYLIH